jgi:hypothetical protein
MHRTFASFRRLLVVLGAPITCAAIAIACTGSDPDLTPSSGSSLADGSTTPSTGGDADDANAASLDATPPPDAGADGELLKNSTFDTCGGDHWWVPNGVTMQAGTESGSCLVCSNQGSSYSIYQLVPVVRLTAGAYVASATIRAPAPDAAASGSMSVGLYYDDGIQGDGDYGGGTPVSIDTDAWSTQTHELDYEGADGGFLEVRIESQTSGNGHCFLIDSASLKKH